MAPLRSVVLLLLLELVLVEREEGHRRSEFVLLSAAVAQAVGSVAVQVAQTSWAGVILQPVAAVNGWLAGQVAQTRWAEVTLQPVAAVNGWLAGLGGGSFYGLVVLVLVTCCSAVVVTLLLLSVLRRWDSWHAEERWKGYGSQKYFLAAGQSF